MARFSPEERAKIDARVAVLREQDRRYKAHIARFLKNANQKGIRIARIKQKA